MNKRFLLLFILLLAAGTVGTGLVQADPPDYWPTDGWQTSTPEAQGMNSATLSMMLDQLQANNPGVDSLLIVRNGYLVFEAYFPPYHQDVTHIIHSCTKSIISALIGIAIDQGSIEGVDVPVLDLFPDWDIDNVDADKEAVTLEHLLMMGSGLECRDSYLYNFRGFRDMTRTNHWAQNLLSLPMEHTPGSHFEYCNGVSHTLSTILSEATGMGAAEFAQENLFGPLGFGDFTWPTDPLGNNTGWGELRIRPRDMARFGLLYLNNGQWDGEQIVPADWVAASTRPQIESGTLSNNYGYQWWVDDNGYHMALGYAGQFIYIVPEANMVVVFTSNLGDNDFFAPETLLNRRIIPAAESTMPLPENPEAFQTLSAQLDGLTPVAEPVPALPETAQEISGQTYACPVESNSLTLDFVEGDDVAVYSGMQDGSIMEPLYIGLDGIFRYNRLEDTGQDLWIQGTWEDEETFVSHYLQRADGIFDGNLTDYWVRFEYAGDDLVLSIGPSPQPEQQQTMTCTAVQ